MLPHAGLAHGLNAKLLCLEGYGSIDSRDDILRCEHLEFEYCGA